MKVESKHYSGIWIDEKNSEIICIIDQRLLPHKFEVLQISNYKDMILAIKDMALRGAPLIGVAGAFAVYLALIEIKYGKYSQYEFDNMIDEIINARPTAVNLYWAVNKVIKKILLLETTEEKIEQARISASEIMQFEIDSCYSIGKYGVELIKNIYKKTKKTVNILTHCNAGWLATVDYGTATAPIYEAKKEGIPIHVWVDETRPRNQGAKLTAWEMLNEGIDHTIIADNTGGLLMQRNLVDIVIVGSDRTSSNGDVANKIGTYLKALAANYHNVPFYVALPTSSIDMSLNDGIRQIHIEERDDTEIKYIEGLNNNGQIESVLICPENSPALNLGFDITPAELVTGLITEKGICKANYNEISKLFIVNK